MKEKTLNSIYIELIRIGLDDPVFALKTDHIKAKLRDEIARVSGIDAQTIQEYHEDKARKEEEAVRSNFNRYM